jgi:prepilin-type N-terminal cleavage/methylation domain-containing protein
MWRRVPPPGGTNERVIMKSRRGLAAGFTLIELLVVITIIGLLAAIIVPSIKGALNSAKNARAMSQIKDLDGAVKRYFAEYGKMPVPPGENGGPDKLYTGADQAKVIEILINANTNQNPKQLVFLDLDPASFGEKTVQDMLTKLAGGMSYKDPWWPEDKDDQREYGILMDLNFDDKITGTPFGEIRAKVAVYSGGRKKDLTNPPFKTW